MQLIPLDTQTPSLHGDEAHARRPTETPIWDTYKEIIARHDPRGADCVTEVERYAFYDRVKTKSCCVIMTGETATYANIILKKGVIA